MEKINSEDGYLKLPLSDDIRCYTYLPDFVKNLLQLAQNATKGIYNLSSAGPISVSQFVHLFAKYSGKEVKNTSTVNNYKPKSFILDVSKAKTQIKKWQETPYEDAIRNILL